MLYNFKKRNIKVSEQWLYFKNREKENTSWHFDVKIVHMLPNLKENSEGKMSIVPQYGTIRVRLWTVSGNSL